MDDLPENGSQDCVDQAALLGGLPEKDCVSHRVHIHGYLTDAARFGVLSGYGSDAPAIRKLADAIPALSCRPRCSARLLRSGSGVGGTRRWLRASILARRTRALFLDAHAAVRMARRVAAILGVELGRDEPWQARQITEFTTLAAGFMVAAE